MIEFLKKLLNFVFGVKKQPDAPIPQVEPEKPAEPIVAPIIVPPQPIAKSRLDLWIEAAIKMEGANPVLNNPGNIRYVAGTWMARIAVGQRNGFCVFEDYATGLSVLREFFTNAATGKSQIYHPTDTIYGFYSKYAPSGDGNDPMHYAQVVAAHIGVSPSLQIKSLV